MNDIQRLQGIYGATGRELRRVLLAIDPANYSDVQAAGARAKAGEMVRTLNVATDRWTTEAIGKAYVKSARTAKTSLQILGRKPRRKTWDDKRRRITDDLMVILLRANNSIHITVDRYLAVLAIASKAVKTAQVQEYKFSDTEGDINKMANDAVKKELGRGTLSGQVRDYLYSLVQDDQFIEIGGRMYHMKKYADLVARTALREAQTAATLDLCHEYENDLVEVSDHGTICDICKPYEGQVYSISGMNPDYPMLDDDPPWHPNCEHSLLPTSEEAIAARGD
jgi:hypothetical protein